MVKRPSKAKAPDQAQASPIAALAARARQRATTLRRREPNPGADPIPDPVSATLLEQMADALERKESS